ncbi:hypothetical protein KZ483_05065 [Paenibacillus sp. sptzw28]|uniref:DUF6220 domain-containing protein n=1 Tax=Paenibacillus sp. sptzw28 TaxID=715179 RepID=UPI001C6DF1B3|nr:DUF6220 domain-containing protein [Paenibacillus sp. sptzw28]QYR22358.1 hypothetical protein KZ483_05065 [Paenibacillus sp. sptzw28]
MTDFRSNQVARLSGFIFLGLSWLLVACIIIQTFIAGMAIFSDAAQWSSHVSFVHLFEFLPILMLIFAFAGRLPRVLGWQTFALFLLLFSQYFTANLPGAGAFHPVIALVLFWLSFRVAGQTARLNSGLGKEEVN